MTNSFDIKPVFIGACPRSGTTFLGDRLGALLRGRVTPESQFKRSVLAALSAGRPEAAVAILDKDRVYRLWQDRPTKDELLRAKSPADFFARLVFPDGLSDGQAPVWIDHTPINLNDFAVLRAAFPAARFVSLVRDGRAVYSSVRNLEWGPNNPICAAPWWASRTAPRLAASLTFPEACMTVRYEDLVRGDLAVWTDLLRFVSSDSEVSVSRDDLGAESGFDVPGYTRHQHQLVGAAPSATRAESWRKDLSPREIEIFELGAGALLDTLWYARDYPFPKVATRGEKIRMGEWPVRISMQPMTKWKLARRWSKVEAYKKGQWT